MRHKKHTFKIGRRPAHRRAMIANLLKALFEHERIETTETKAKELRRHAEKLIELAKTGTLASRRQAAALLHLRYNTLTIKEAKAAKKGNLAAYNFDRKVLKKLFSEIQERFQTRAGGYTRIMKSSERVGDRAPKCLIELV
ncbi:MAG: 50S ribosomal protein L17 [Parachlamydiales bacterium]|jgi:large subunit ribosomal protein L17